MRAGKQILISRYESIYGPEAGRKMAERDDRRTKGYYVLVAFCLIVSLLFGIISGKEGSVATKENSRGELLYIQRPAKGEGSAVLDAKVQAKNKNGEVEEVKEIRIDEKGAGESKTAEEGMIREEPETDRLKRKIDAAVRQVNDDTDEGVVALPKELDDGTKLVWKKENRSNMPMVIVIFLFLGGAVYVGRFSRIKKEEAMARESVMRELPGFINKTVLLLQGGIVITDAVSRIIRDRRALGDGGYFYDQMWQIEARVARTNSPMHEELSAFAKRSGVRELMRLSNIISDNIDKGADLTGKLAAESSMLWFARKKHAEEKGRLAETKLTMPLVILIIALVMITIAPALLEI